MLSVTLVACAFLIIWPVYRLARRYLARSPLDVVPGPMSESWAIGNLAYMYNRNAWRTHKEVEETYGSVMKFYGVFGERQLYVSDPKALHYIFIKEYESYVEPEVFYINNTIHFGDGIFSHNGELHKKYRRILSPMFSLSHLREQTPTFFEVTNKVKKTWQQKLANGPQEVEVLNWTTRTALELIGQAGLGYSFDQLTDKDEASPYANAVKQLVPTEAPYLPAAVYLLPILYKLGTPRFWKWVVDTLPWKELHKVRDTIATMDEYAYKVLEGKKALVRAEAEGDVTEKIAVAGGAKDIITRLIKANMAASEKDKISDEEVLGNMSGMIFAAMDTTSSAIARTLHTLALHPSAQDRLRAELTTAFGSSDELSHDELNELPFLDAVCRETMRVYTPVTTVPRVTAKPTVLPLHTPLPSAVPGQPPLTAVPVPAGTSLYISVVSSNTNPVIWGDDGRQWKPERWLKVNKPEATKEEGGGHPDDDESNNKAIVNGLPDSVKKAGIPGVYPHLMTFLAGPYSCLGFTFAQLEMKVVLSVLVKSFKFELTPADAHTIWETALISSPLYVDPETGEKTSMLPMKVTAVF